MAGLNWITDVRHYALADWPHDPRLVDPGLVLDMDVICSEAGVKFCVHEAYATSGHADDSYHYRGLAVDGHFAPGLTPAQQFRLLYLRGFGGVGWYPGWNNPGWHVDKRPGARVFWFREGDRYVYGLSPLLARLGVTLAEVEAASGPLSSGFLTAHGFTSQAEGGRSDHPKDPGGPTGFGVSLRFLRGLDKELGDIDRDGDIDASDIDALTPADAERLMRLSFWDGLRMALLPLRVACCQYDFAVNAGPATAGRVLQETCNFIFKPVLAVDGIVGPATRARVAEICKSLQAETAFCRMLINGRRAYYRSLDKPEFETGWLRRCDALEQYIGGLK